MKAAAAAAFGGGFSPNSAMAAASASRTAAGVASAVEGIDETFVLVSPGSNLAPAEEKRYQFSRNVMICPLIAGARASAFG
jgi:hypothetical protein